ncbi:MAG: hypothetical protein JNJ88_10060 [Planctomycetes bacterium]|nr:hypothetical protein [Planctomycetota bacterium]
MSSRIAKTIFDLFARQGRDAQVQDLAKQGIEKVTLLGADQLAVLVERALDRALEQRMLELTEPEKAQLLERAHAEFEALRAQLQGLEGEADAKRRQLEELEGRLGTLHKDFQSANASLDAELAAASAEGAEFAEADVDAATLIAIIQNAGVRDAAAAQRVALAIAEHLRAERSRAAEAAARAQRERIENLERRLAKLNDTLSRTEEELERALQSGERVEGVASIYRTVQGLRASAKEFERKRAMLSDIFQKNLILQKGAATA